MNSTDLAWLLYSSGYLVVALVFLLIAKILYNLVTPFCVNEQLTEKDNPALGIHFFGYLFGILAVICSVFYGDTETPSLSTFLEEIQEVALYGGLGIVLLLIAGLINDKVFLNTFNNRTEIIDKENKAVAFVTASTYISSGLIIAAAIFASIDLFSLLMFYVIGQIILLIFMSLYKGLTKFDDQKELGEAQNVAVALAISGNMIAYSLILMKGIAVNPAISVDWTLGDRLLNLAYYAIGGLVLISIVRLVADYIFMPKAKIHKELVEDKNINAGLMEGTLVLSMGLILSLCL